jgi:sugar/nucleoside kinase (ribokinase family)
MGEVWTMGEMLVEIMRPEIDMELYETGEFIGPFASGAPAIFIDTVARLGHTAGIFGGVGKDDFGKAILNRLRKDGVNVDFVFEDESRSTAVAFVTYFKDGSRKFIYHIDNTPAICSKPLDMVKIQSPKYFHIMGCSLMASDVLRENIIDCANAFLQAGAKISFDPNIRQELLGNQAIDRIISEVLKNCSVIMPGTQELLLLTGAETVEEGVRILFENEKMEIVALKNGKDNSVIYSRHEKVICPVYEVRQVDPTGAGDCFDAALLCGLLEGKTLADAGKMASAAGALNVMRLGPMEGEINAGSVASLMLGC